MERLLDILYRKKIPLPDYVRFYLFILLIFLSLIVFISGVEQNLASYYSWKTMNYPGYDEAMSSEYKTLISHFPGLMSDEEIFRNLKILSILSLIFYSLFSFVFGIFLGDILVYSWRRKDVKK